jgi:hypothetical protein
MRYKVFVQGKMEFWDVKKKYGVEREIFKRKGQ